MLRLARPFHSVASNQLVRLEWASKFAEHEVAIVTLNRPEKLNAMTVEMGQQFQALMHNLQQSSKLRAVVVTGAGRAFSAGGDLQFLLEKTQSDSHMASREMRAFYQRFLCLRDLPVPVVAAINGAAVGAGMCLALACDMRICAKFGLPFPHLGLHPGMGTTSLLPAAVGFQQAARLALTGDLVTGEEAAKIGLVLDAVPTEQVLPHTLSLVERILKGSQAAVNSTIRSLRLRQDANMEAALWREADAQAHNFASEELRQRVLQAQAEVSRKK